MRKKLYLFLIIILFVGITTGCTASPENVVQGFFDSMKKGELESFPQYVYDKKGNKNFSSIIRDKPEQAELIKAIFSKLTYEIKSGDKSGDTAQVDAKVTSPDLVRISGKMITEIMPMAFDSSFNETNGDQTEKMMQQYMMNSISDPQAPLTSSDIIIHLKKVNDKWMIVPNDDLMNAMTGNISKAFPGK